MEPTKKVVDFIVNAKFQDLPEKGITIAKQSFLDCIGVTLAGSASPQAKIVMELVRENGGLPKATVIGAGFKTSTPQAALINGTSAHALDYDDTNKLVRGHPSVFLVRVVMALGEDFGISGIEALEAYIIGLEIAAKVGNGINPGHYEKGWHATATLGTLGAAAAGAKMLKLNTDQTRMAMGIATSLASGSMRNFGTMTKPLHAGNAAQMGIVAARLAQKGFTADKNILEAKFGFCDLFSKEGKYDIKKITDSLGQPFAIITPGINLKPYPSCRNTHAALDAMLELVGKETIPVEDVESVEVRVVPLSAQILIHSTPRSALEGKFSMQFCIATAILNKQLKLEDFTDERVLNHRTQDMMKKVKMVADTTLEGIESPAVLKVKLKNGKEYSNRVNRPKGHPEVPMSRNEFLAKYRDCAGRILSTEAADRVMDMIENLESIKDLGTLADLLIGGK